LGRRKRRCQHALLDEDDLAFCVARGNFDRVSVQSKDAGMLPCIHWTHRFAAHWPDLADLQRSTTGADVALHQPCGLAFCLSESAFAQRAAMVARMPNESGDAGTRLLGRNKVRTVAPGLGEAVAGAA
jgi:octopine oxidase subunit B